MSYEWERLMIDMGDGDPDNDDCDFEAEVGGFIIWLILFGILFYNWN